MYLRLGLRIGKQVIEDAKQLFTYEDIINPTLILDLADSSTISLNGSNFVQINDKSGNGYHAIQNTASLQPLYEPTGMNGKPCIYFDGSTRLEGNWVAQGFLEVYVVMSHTSGLGQNNARLFTCFNVANQEFQGTDTAIFIFRPSNTLDIIRNYQAGSNRSTINVPFDTPTIFSSHLDPNTGYKVRANAVEGSTGTGTPTALNSIRYEISGSLGTWGGRLSKLIVCPIQTPGIRDKIIGSLAWDAGTTASLPADFPYKNLPPYK